MIDVGQTVGNYTVTGKLGEGGMGAVFLAEHPVIGSKVALKAIHAQFARNFEVVSRFVNEAKSVNQIGHDHIVNITDFGNTADGDFYFIMEYLMGKTLSAQIRNGGAFSPARAVNIAAQIADALGASHAHGIIHRDLKPENIFLIVRDSTDDFVKVVDFGIAKLIARDEPLHKTRVGVLMGTPTYMSPEQCEGKIEVDHRTDIYSLGVILFEMLTGLIPFAGQGYGEIMVKHITVQPPTARSIVPDLPPALDAIVSRCLSKDPAQRFQSMNGFRDALLDPAALLSSTAARPMVRAANNLQSAPAPARPAASWPQGVDGPGHRPSTFRGSVGEIRQDDDRVIPGRHRVRNVILTGVAAVASVAAVGALFLGAPPRFHVAAAVGAGPATVAIEDNLRRDGDPVRTTFIVANRFPPIVAPLPAAAAVPVVIPVVQAPVIVAATVAARGSHVRARVRVARRLSRSPADLDGVLTPAGF